MGQQSATPASSSSDIKSRPPLAELPAIKACFSDLAAGQLHISEDVYIRRFSAPSNDVFARLSYKFVTREGPLNEARYSKLVVLAASFGVFFQHMILRH
jgi:hypothetical protein